MNWIIDLFKNQVFQTVFSTVVSGTILFILGETVQKFILEPIKEFKKLIGKIDNRLKYYANVLNNSGFEPKVVSETSEIIRNLSCDLESSYKQIPCPTFFSLPCRKQISIAASTLIGLSNSGGKKDREDINVKKIGLIRKNLNIKEI